MPEALHRQVVLGLWSPHAIDVSDTEVWGVSSAHHIYKRPADGSGSWTYIPGRLKHVSVGPRWVWGVNGDDRIYKCPRPCGFAPASGTGSGTQMQLDVGNTDVGGINSTHMIYP